MKLMIHANPRFPETADEGAPWLRFLTGLATGIGERDDAVELSFLDDEEIRRVNAEYRGKDSATDVLSFHYGRSAPGEAGAEEDPFGEILISVETARRQAEDMSHGAEEELSLLAIHGLFHIMGMDHEEEEEAARMAEAEEPYRRSLSDFFDSRS